METPDKQIRSLEALGQNEPLPQGIAPKILLTYVRNTSPYLFDWQGDVPPYVRTLQETAKWLERLGPDLKLDHPRYYELCVSAHWATVATFVPTDVDSQIRFKLWHPTIDPETLEALVKTVENARTWNFAPVTTRWVKSDESAYLLSGHNGEWFTIAAGAYGCLRRKNPKRADEILVQIEEELLAHEKLWTEKFRAQNGIALLKTATLIAHNLGDLQRVIEMWELPETDPLKLLHDRYTAPSTALWKAGELNKKMMAVENHRHFALRKPKCLRKNVDFLLPIGPFFDDWGGMIARHPDLAPEEIGDIAEALVDGWVFLEGPVGYARALAGIEGSLKGGLQELSSLLPSRIAKTLKTGKLRTQISVSQPRFEAQWTAIALKSIPV